jgi:hypothetical protein
LLCSGEDEEKKRPLLGTFFKYLRTLRLGSVSDEASLSLGLVVGRHTQYQDEYSLTILVAQRVCDNLLHFHKKDQIQNF